MSHRFIVQVFQHAAFSETLDANSGQQGPSITPLQSGPAYLEAAGAPPASIAAGQSVWVTGPATVVATPNGLPVIQTGQNFSMQLTGSSTWQAGTLWYHVQWTAIGGSGAGWLPATNLTFTAPAKSADAWTSIAMLSPSLARYLGGLGTNVGVAVYDVTRHEYYTYHANEQFTVASSIKVPIMVTFLSQTEAQSREPGSDELYLLTTMIENSDNDSAQALIEEIGGTPAITDVLNQAGVHEFSGNEDHWGWSTISPLSMVQLLTALHTGTILNQQDRALAMNLMSNIESDEQQGVGSTAPTGAAVAMKDGWVNEPDGFWAVNSSGIVSVHGETYIIPSTQLNRTLSMTDGTSSRLSAGRLLNRSPDRQSRSGSSPVGTFSCRRCSRSARNMSVSASRRRSTLAPAERIRASRHFELHPRARLATIKRLQHDQGIGIALILADDGRQAKFTNRLLEPGAIDA